MLCLRVLCLLLIAPISMWAQNSPQKPDSSANNSDDAAGELRALRESLSQTQRQVASQQEEIEALKHLLSARQSASAGTQQEALEASNAADPTQPIFPSAGSYAGGNFGIQPAAQGEGQEKESPLSFKIGSATFTPGGFVDIENIFRTTNTQNNIATSLPRFRSATRRREILASFVYRTVFALQHDGRGQICGAKNDRLCARADFSGNDATNVYQTVNGQHTNRATTLFRGLQAGQVGVLGGQTWSWLTPNRTGIGRIPARSRHYLQRGSEHRVGLPYTRAAEFRVAYQLNEHWAMGAGHREPESVHRHLRRSAGGLHFDTWAAVRQRIPNRRRQCFFRTFFPKSLTIGTCPADISMRKPPGSSPARTPP